MKKILLILCSTVMVAAAPASTVLLNDTFADGDRTNTNLPNESGFWASTAGDVTTSVGTVTLTMGSSSRRVHTYFAPSTTPASLSVGDVLTATVTFSPTGGFNDNTSRNFRFGLFYDGGNQHARDGVGDSGISNSWYDATGYAVQFGMGVETAAAARAGKRTETAGTYSLLGSDGAYTWGENAEDLATGLTLGTVYTLQMTLNYQAADEMLVSFAFMQGDTVIATASLLDDGLGGKPIYTDFDMLLFRLSSNGGTADVVNFHSINVTYIPEPATLVLLGLGSVLGLKRRR